MSAGIQAQNLGFEVERLLRNPARQRIVRSIEHRPKPIRQLCEELGIGIGALYHHLKKLEGAGQVTLVRSGAHMLVALGGSPGRVEVPWGKTAWATAVALDRTPGATHAQLALQTGIREPLVRYHVRRLANEGFVELRREDALRIWPTRRLHERVAPARITSNQRLV